MQATIEKQIGQMTDRELSALVHMAGAELQDRDLRDEKSLGVASKQTTQAPLGTTADILAQLRAKAKTLQNPNTLALGVLYERLTGKTSATVEHLLRELVFEELRRRDHCLCASSERLPGRTG